MEEINWDDYLRDDDIPEYRTKANNFSVDDELYEAPVVVSESFHESLISQLRLRNLSEEDLELAIYLVGTIDDDGILRRSMEDIVDDLAFSQGVFTDEKELERLLMIIQDLDPAGVGGRNLQECLILQLIFLDTQAVHQFLIMAFHENIKVVLEDTQGKIYS